MEIGSYSRTSASGRIAEAMRPVDLLMRQAVADGVFPGGVLLASKGRTVRMHTAYGQADPSTGSRMARTTFFDLASLTKPLATTLAVMRLSQEGRLVLDDPLEKLLAPFQRTDKGRITIRQLLVHTSGLPDYRPYYETLRELPRGDRPARLQQLLLAEPLLGPPGHDTLYSDLGFMILAWVVENLTGKRLDRFVERAIYRPLGLKNLFFIDLAAPRRRAGFAVTERCPWRGMVLRGAVHDDNAFILGGIAGHAGLFGTADDIYRLLSVLLAAWHGRAGSAVFRPELVRTFLNRAAGAERALGFDAPAPVGASCGRHFSEETVGHLGFTGTSFWMDLKRSVIIVLLTNRVYPSRENIRIRLFRPVLHDAVMTALRTAADR